MYKEYNKNIYHCRKRILEAEIKSNKDITKFKKIMLTRLNKITTMDKLNASIHVLKDFGYYDIAEIYESKKLLMNLKDAK